MWEFIKYCFKCAGIAIAGAFGYNPPGLTLKTGIIGILTLFVSLGLLLLTLYLISLVVNKIR